jgi:hypothetical protein
MRIAAAALAGFGLLLALAEPRIAPRLVIVAAAVILAAWCAERIREITIRVPVSNDRIRRRVTRQPDGVAAELRDLEAIIASRHSRVDVHLRRQVGRVAAHRLQAHHGVDLWSPDDAQRARALVSGDLWLVINPEAELVGPNAKPRVAMANLPDILTELEHL